jgi:hypothetical protein
MTEGDLDWRSSLVSGYPDLWLQVLGALTDDGAMPLADLLNRLRSNRDPATAVMVLACADLIELDLVVAPLGPRTMMRLRQ